MTHGTRLCPGLCGRIAKAGHLLCPPCWASLDDGHKRAVLRTHARWRANIRDGSGLRAYRKAANAAIKSLGTTASPTACSRCGCTLENRCIGGCTWTEPGLCSRCAERNQP